MIRLNLFRTPKHQRFEYHPRYWDPDKEELERRISRSKNDTDDVAAMRHRISAGLRRNRGGGGKSMSNIARSSNLRLVIVLVAIILITMVIINKYLPAIVKLYGL